MRSAAAWMLAGLGILVAGASPVSGNGGRAVAADSDAGTEAVDGNGGAAAANGNGAAVSPNGDGGTPAASELTETDLAALRVYEGVLQLFSLEPAALWPGYDLARQPFIAYLPERWAILFNGPQRAEGFSPPPAGWPDLWPSMQVCLGQYRDLAGQLVLDLPLDSLRIAAVPYQGRSAAEEIAFLVHEAFHQYQAAAFGEIGWEREEKYPIEDRENTALAVLEARLLIDALNAAAEVATRDACLRQFAAVRDHRWRRGDDYLRTYEQGQEVNEGTAKYVEVMGVERMSALRYASRGQAAVASGHRDGNAPLPAAPGVRSAREALSDAFHDLISGGSISPEDMPRNRIYLVACAQALLLDDLGAEWKPAAQHAGPDFTFAGFMRERLGSGGPGDSPSVSGAENASDAAGAALGDALPAAMARYGYEEILAATDASIRAHREGFEQELRLFDAQPGCRVELELSGRGLTRSRSSTATKWLVDQGARELRNHFDIYSLKGADLELQVKDTGILEENDWASRDKRVILYASETPSISVDGRASGASTGEVSAFDSLRVEGPGIHLLCHRPGTLRMEAGRIAIDLTP